MYSKLLDDRTLGEVIAAAPVERDDVERAALRALKVLIQETGFPVGSRLVQDGPVYFYEMSIRTLAIQLDGVYSPKLVGQAVHELGLKSMRKRDGFYLAWTKRQIEILRNYLAV